MHFTYLIIGLGLLGVGAGAVLVAVFPRLRAVAIEKLVATTTIAAAAAAGLGYVVIAYVELSTYALPPSGPALLRLMAVSGALFSTFLAAGVMIASLFASRPESIPRLYFADLVGAGLGCAAAVPLMLLISPPGCVFSGAAVFALAGIRPALMARQRALAAIAGVVAVVLAVVAVTPGARPTLVVDPNKSLGRIHVDDRFRVIFSQWHPIFRVDVVETDLASHFMGIIHDGQAIPTGTRSRARTARFLNGMKFLYWICRSAAKPRCRGFPTAIPTSCATCLAWGLFLELLWS